jgi:hypothetical protein
MPILSQTSDDSEADSIFTIHASQQLLASVVSVSEVLRDLLVDFCIIFEFGIQNPVEATHCRDLRFSPSVSPTDRTYHDVLYVSSSSIRHFTVLVIH